MLFCFSGSSVQILPSNAWFLLRAVFDCLFLSGSLIQEENNVVISVTSSQTMDKRDIQAVVRALRQIAKSSAQIICSTILETALEHIPYSCQFIKEET